MANGDANAWPTLSRLTDMPERDRRLKLRSHREARIDIQQDRELREALDRELGRLGHLELRAEAAGGEWQDQALSEIKAVNDQFKDLIQNSAAFAHYLDSYLYFKIRFVAGRRPDRNPCPPRDDSAAEQKEPPEQLNKRPVGLPTPPPCEGPARNELNDDVQRFLGLGNSPDAEEALKFLDDQVAETGEARRFDLWLRGLLRLDDDTRFQRLARGLYQWANQRYEYYADIERRNGGGERVTKWRENPRVEGAWHARNPLAARCGVCDLYWLSKLLRAEVTPRGTVSYVDRRSWLHYLPSVSEDYSKEVILRIEDVLRSVFDYTCDLIQNAVEMAESCENVTAHPDDYPKRPQESVDWRAAYDQEMYEIACHRRERMYPDHETLGPPPPFRDGKRAYQYWSERIRTGAYEDNLVGVALSGGGIRSATFALGVLQGLKELDLLRRVDYLSTVSGGGYIGSWLVGNVRRTRYWLSQMISWEASISHLRRYSKYLAPQSGLLSADTWVMWNTWIRNAMLIQLTAVAWLSGLFTLALALKALFEWCGGANTGSAQFVLAAGFILLAVRLGVYLWKARWRPPSQHLETVLLTWLGAFLTAALLWSRTSGEQRYSEILKSEVGSWPWYIGLGLLLSLWGMALVSVQPLNPLRILGSLCAAGLSAGVVYMTLCAVRYLFGIWASLDEGKEHYGWYAYVFGPALVLLGVTLAVIVFIGLVGRASADWRREWWTRYGSWLAIYGTGFLALGLVAVFGHVWLSGLFALKYKIPWAAVAGWVGSVIAGLLAGNSNRTRGNGAGASTALEWVARIGGVLFIAGAVLAASSLLHLVLVQVWLDNPQLYWWQNLNTLLSTNGPMLATLIALVICGAIFSWRFNLNTFGLNQFYRNRLVRCYLGATRWKPGLRRPHRFTGFDEDDNLPLTDLRFDVILDNERFRGPLPIVNCALNLGGSSDLLVHTRQSASFSMTPLHCGVDRPKVGYAPLTAPDGTAGFAGGVTLGQAISVSGAAASPNMGYNTSPLVAVLLTLFNVRLAWWFPNPGRDDWRRASPPVSILYLVEELLGLADETSDYVNVSDGGHFENLGIYELIRRRAKVIIVSDAECDPDLSFGSLGNVIRICETDFGAKIDIDVTSVRKQPDGNNQAHCAVGRITYRNGSIGHLIYLKASLTGDEDVAVAQYHALHPDFPHQTTADQFFTEDQFESYRRLGHHITKLAFRGADLAPATTTGANLVDPAAQLYDLWTSSGFSNDAFVKHAEILDQLWERFRASAELRLLLQELVADRPGARRQDAPTPEEQCACMELAQLMENVFLDLRLDDFWEHPDNRGWAMLFTMWAKSATFQAAWNQIRRTFGIRFEYFCEERLGLDRDRPVVRV